MLALMYLICVILVMLMLWGLGRYEFNGDKLQPVQNRNPTIAHSQYPDTQRNSHTSIEIGVCY